jgi:hypothetical protein
VWHIPRCPVCRDGPFACNEWQEILDDFPSPVTGRFPEPSGPPPSWAEDWGSPEDAAYDLDENVALWLVEVDIVQAEIAKGRPGSDQEELRALRNLADAVRAARG